MAQYQDTKTGGTAPNIRKTPDLRRTPDLYRTLNIRKVLNIRKILLLLDNRSRMYEVSRAREDKASRPILDAEEVTVLLSINAKGLRILLSKDLYICLIKED